MMKQKITHLLFATAIFCIGMFVANQSKAQTTIAVQDFETSPATPTMTYSATSSGTPGASTGVSSGTTASSGDSPASVNLFVGGSKGYRMQGPASGSATTSQILTFSNVNTSAYTSIQLSLRVAGMSIGSASNGMDATIDEVLIEVSPDGGTTWYQQSKVTSTQTNARWSFGATGSGSRAYAANNTFSTFSTTVVGPTTSGTSAITTLTVTSLPSISNLKIRVTMTDNSANESWIIDDVIITGTLSCTAPTTQTAFGTISSTTGGMTIPVSGGNGDSRLIRFNTSAPSLSPVDGTTYTAATSYATAGTEQTVMAGTGTTVTVSNLAANTLYYYKAWEYNACSASPKYNTTSAPSGSFTTLQNAPTVGSGSGATSTSFTAAWTAPSGGGATYTYSIDVDDNSSFTSINFSQTGIASGTTTANVNSGLSANTPYYFRVKAVNAGGSSAWSSTSAAYSTLPGDPTVATPSVTNITDVSADLGADITSNGGGTITDYGTVYKTSAGVTITDNFLSAGTSNITGTFSHTRSLSAETHYYYKGYATNAANTVLTSTEGNFYTLSTAPNAAAGSFSSSPFSYSQIDLTFAAASTITNADGYIILQRIGAAPTGTPTNATAYSVGNTIGNGTVAAIVNSTSATTQSITGLSANTNYYFVIIPYNADGSSTAATYNYYSTSAPSTNATTPTVPTPTIASFTSHEYVGGIMTITGTNLSGVTSVTIGGTSVPFVLNVSNLDVTVGTSSGQLSITNGTNSANSGASNFSNDGYITILAGPYSTPATWQGGVPTTTLPITIAHAVTLSAAVTVSPTAININSSGSLALGSYTITSSGSVSNNGTLDLGTGTLTLASGISIANTNTFTSGTGTIVFSGSNTVTGTHSFYNTTLNGSVNFGSASTITGTMTMNTGASVTTNAPTYATGSTLAYAVSLTAGTEWASNVASGAGVPYHVTIATGTTLTLGASNYRQLLGNLTTTGALTLSSSNDLKIAGNWSGAGTFTHGNRKVYFNGTTQTISKTTASGSSPLYDVEVASSGSTGATFSAASYVANVLTVNSGATLTTSNTLTLNSSSGSPSLIAGTLINSTAGTTTINNSLGMTVQSTGTWVHNSTGAISTPLGKTTFATGSTFIYRSTASTASPGVSISGQSFYNLRLENTNASTWTAAPAGSSSCIVNGDLFIGSLVTLSTYSGILTVAGNVNINGVVSSTIAKIAMSGSGKTFGGSGTIALSTFSVSSLGDVTLNNNFSVATSATVSGKLNMGINVVSGTGGIFTVASGATLSIGHSNGINGNITTTGSNSYSTTANYIFNGASSQTTGASFPATVNNFEVNGAGISTLTNSLTVNGTLTLTTGNITLGSSSVVISSTGTLTGGSNSSYFATTGTGTLTLPNVSGTPKLFPVGLAASYTPVTLTNSGTTSNFSVRAKSSITNAAYGAKYVDVEWPITAATSGSNISAVFQWNNTNQVGSFNPLNSCELARWTGSGYLVTNTGITPSGTDPYTLTASGLTSFTSPNNIYVLGEVSNVTQPVTIPTLSSFTPDAGYGGTTITLSGSDFFGVSQVTIGGQPVSILSNNGSNTITVVAGGRSGQIIVTNSAGSASSSALSPNAFRSYGYKTTQAGDWNTAATWFNNLIPQVGSHVTVDHFITINASVTDQMDSVIITTNGKITTGSSSATLTCGNIYNNNIIDMTIGGTITLAGSSTFTNANTFTAGAGKIAFAGVGACVGAFTFNNIDASGALNVGSSTTVNGILQILNGGSLTNYSPIYGSASTLQYATTGTASPTSYEWASNTASGAGVPQNVTISSNTNLDFGSSSQYYQLLGAITVNSGSTLTLSSQSGGDLKIKGNFACSGTFTPNNRTVEFNGTAQSITTANTFNFIKVDAATALSIAATGVTLNGTGSNALQVDNTATLNINSSKSLILNAGSSANIDGTVNNSGIFTNSNTATGNLIFTSTALYQHSVSGGSVPAFGTWNTGSTCEIKVAGTSAPTNLGQTFYNFKWNCTTQAAACNLGGNLTAITGDFTVASTNNYDLRLFTNAVSLTLTVGGNMNINANAWVAIINSGSTGTGSSALTINGNLTINNGTLDMGGTDSHVATKTTLNLKGDVTIVGSGAITKTNGTPAEMNFIKSSGTQTFTSSNNYVIGNHLSVFHINIGNGTSTNKLALANDFILSSTTTATNNVITVKTNATLSCGTSIIDEDASGNKATFTVQAGATLESGSATGIDGNIQTYSSARTLPTTANYSYNGAVNQVTGSLLPTTVNTLNIANTLSGGVVSLTNASVTPTNLNLTSGDFDLNAHTVNMPTSGVITATAGNFANTLFSNSKLNFAGSNTVSGSVNFYPKVNLNGSVDFGSASTINDTMVMNTGASITTNPPSYAIGSKLRYNQGGTIARSNEWNATTGAGFPHHIQISNNTTVNVSNGAPSVARSIAGDLTINAGSKLNMNTATDQMTAALIVGGTTNLYGTLELSALSGANINVAGNWIHDASASFIENGSPVIFAGTVPQTIQINGGGIESFDNLVLNNTSTGLSSGILLGSSPNATNLDINTTLTLTSGKLNTNGNEVFVKNSLAAAITGYAAIHSSTANSYVIGNLRRRVSTTTMAAYEFPLGTDAGKYEIAKINITSNTDVDNLLANFTEFNPSCPFAGNAPNFSVTPTNGGIPTLVDNMLNLGYYIVEPYDASKTLVASPTITYDATMTFNGHNNGALSLVARCYTIIKRSSSCTGAWSLAGGSLNNTTQQYTAGASSTITATLSGLTSFSQFGAGFNSNGDVLPVELTEFNVALKNNNAELKWITASERNSEKFEIERSTDGILFDKAGFVDAAGSSNNLITYNFIDKNVSALNVNVIYYRLRQVDFDGSYSYSPIKSININKSFTGLSIDAIYPNPFMESVKIKVAMQNAANLTYELYDNKGTIVLTNNVTVDKGESTIIINGLSNLSQGIYLLKMNDGVNVHTSILQKQ